MSILLKASSITNLSDARYFASYHADMLGFCFNPKSPDFVNPYKMNEIAGWIEGPKRVGEFDQLSVESILDTIHTQALDYAQIPLINITGQHAAIDSVPFILEIDIEKWTNEVAEKTEVVYTEGDFVLLKANENVLNSETLQHQISFVCNKYPTILEFNFTAENISGIINAFHPAGIAIKGSQEEKTGLKNFEALNDLLEKLQSEF